MPTFIPETGVGYHAKNREIKKGYSPINQVIKINQAIRRNLQWQFIQL
nr:MAG TPA: hypothetical protein [Caudoviricetes sp.]